MKLDDKRLHFTFPSVRDSLICLIIPRFRFASVSNCLSLLMTTRTSNLNETRETRREVTHLDRILPPFLLVFIRFDQWQNEADRILITIEKRSI